MQRNLFVVMRIRSPVVLSYLDAGFEPPCGRKDYSCACCCLIPSWVLVLLNALEITVEERPLALKMCLHDHDVRPETRLKKGSFSPQNGPLCGTTAWYMPY